MSKMSTMAAAAARAAHRPAYMAWVLTEYAAAEGLNAEEMASALGVRLADLPRLGLCLCPRSEHFAADVAKIGAAWDANPAALARIVRHVEVLQGMAVATVTALPEQGMLLAARARPKRAAAKEEKP